MAIGFGATDGAGTTDSIEMQMSAHATLRSYGVWFWRTGAGGGGFGRIFDKRVAGAQVDEVYVDNAAATINYSRTWDGATAVWTAPKPTDSAWHHLLVTYDAGLAANAPIIYVDGVSQTVTEVQPASGAIVDNADNYVWGNRKNDTARVWDGRLAEAAIWNRILSAAEATGLALGHAPLSYPRLLAAYMPLVRAVIEYKDASPTVVGTAVQTHPRVAYPARMWQMPPSLATVDVTGTGAITIAGPVLAGTGAFSTTGTGAVAIAAPVLAGTGSFATTGSGAVAIAAPVLAATGAFSTTGTGAVSVGAPVLAGTGSFATVGTGAVTLGAPVLAGTGSFATVGTGAITIGRPILAGTNIAAPDVPGTVAVGRARVTVEAATLRLGTPRVGVAAAVLHLGTPAVVSEHSTGSVSVGG